jgi:hypothetical protein
MEELENCKHVHGLKLASMLKDEIVLEINLFGPVM